ncbi:MAG: UDP-glucose--hexose-1-phosphate uridylyltransferase [Pontixanthobacter sp.]
MSASDRPHRRLNRLTGDWVLVSPQRMGRPWQGEYESAASVEGVAHDPNCYLCPGNARVGGMNNPAYENTFLFPNDFPALLSDETHSDEIADSVFREQPVRGEAHVLCYSPNHSQTLARMDDDGRCAVIDAWCDLSQRLGSKWANVQLFENKGAMMGASSPHPHGQAWAGDFVPSLVAKEDSEQRKYSENAGRSLLADLIAEEDTGDGARLVASSEHWLAVVPHWAAWPFEVLLVARGPVVRLEELSEPARVDLATMLGRVLGAYDRLFDTDFPYSFGWHGAPHGLAADTGHWRLHAHFYPPLLRSAEIRKHMVGFELLAETQRDLTPEAAAQRLREAIA